MTTILSSSPNTKQPMIFHNQIFARVRLAELNDAPHIYKLMHQLTLYHKLGHIFTATEESVVENLFKSNTSPPFQSATVLLLEVSPNPFPSDITNPFFNPIVNSVTLDQPIVDHESVEFRTYRNSVYVAGYIMFFPLYSGFYSKPGFYMENLYVRECYRAKGIGGMLFDALASKTATMGLSTIEWHVSTWNANTIGFYKRKGSYVVEDVVFCTLHGDALQKYGNNGS